MTKWYEAAPLAGQPQSPRKWYESAPLAASAVGEDGVPERLRRPEYTQRDLAAQERLRTHPRRSWDQKVLQAWNQVVDTVPFYDEMVGASNAVASGAYHLPGHVAKELGGDTGARDAWFGKVGDAYAQARGNFNAVADAGEREMPKVSSGLRGAGYGLQMLVPGLQGHAARGAATQAAAQAARPAATTLLGKTGRALETFGRAGVAGSGYGALYAAGEGDTAQERIRAATDGAMTGFGAGGLAGVAGKYVVPPIAAFLGRAKQAIAPSAERRATALVERAMGRDGISMAQLEKAGNSMRAQGGATRETLAEVVPYAKGADRQGTGLKRLARAVHAVPGKASGMADDLFARRRKQMRTDLSAAAAKGSGQNVDDFADTVIEIDQRLRANNTANYDAFRQGGLNPQAFAQRLEPMLRSERGKRAMLSAAQAAEDVAMTLRARGDPTGAAMADEAAQLRRYAQGGNDVPSPRMLDETIKALDDQIAEAGGQRVYSGGQIYGLQKAMREALGDATDGRYTQAISDFSEGRFLQEAIDEGYSAFNRPAHEMERFLSGYDRDGRIIRHGPLTGSQQEAYTLGFTRAVSDAINKRDVSALRRLAEDADLQGKLKTLMGSNYTPFMNRINRIMKQKQFADFVGGGSPTARIQQDIVDATEEGDILSRALDDAARSGSVNIMGALQNQALRPVMDAAAGAYRNMRYPGAKSPKVNELLGKLLFTPMTPAQMKAARAFMEQSKLPPPPPQVSGGQAAGLGAMAGAAAGVSAASQDPYVQDYVGTQGEAIDTIRLNEDLAYADPATPPEERAAIFRRASPERRRILEALRRLELGEPAPAPAP